MATYFIDPTTGDDSDTGLTEALAWETLDNIDDGHLNPFDVVQLKAGEVFKQQLKLSTGGGFGTDDIRIGRYGTGANPIVDPSCLLSDGSKYKFTLSGSGTNEYHVEDIGGGDPNLSDASGAWLDDLLMVKATIGSLADHEWGWGDNDGLGYSTFYLRDNSDDPDSTGVTVNKSDTNINFHRACIIHGDYDNLIVEDIEFRYGEVGGLVFIDEAATGTGDNGIIRRCKVHGLANAVGTGIGSFAASGVRNNWLIEDCEVYDISGSGIAMSTGSDGWTIRGNTVYDVCLGPDSDFTAGIKMNVSDNHIIENNVVHDVGTNVGGPQDSGAGIWGDQSTDNLIFRYNTVYNFHYQGIKVEISDDCQVYYNLVYDEGSPHATVAHPFPAGINIGRGDEDRNQRNKCYNNTVHNCRNGIFVSGSFPPEANNCNDNEIINNRVTNSSTRAFWIIRGGENDGTFGAGNIYENNVLEEVTDFVRWGDSGPNYSTISAWETAQSEAINHLDGDDTEYTDEASDDYSLKAGAAGIGAGKDVGLSLDILGNAVPTIPTIGAYEFLSIAPSSYTATLNGSNVDHAWTNEDGDVYRKQVLRWDPGQDPEVDPGTDEGIFSAGTTSVSTPAPTVGGIYQYAIALLSLTSDAIIAVSSLDSITIAAVLEQEGYRFRNDDGSEITATWIDTQDLNVELAPGESLRLRILVNATDDPAPKGFRLEGQKVGDPTFRKVFIIP